MSRLNREILFGIGKKLIEENGNLDSVIRFGFSGKETFNALKNVFASVSTVALFDNHILIGWNKKCLVIDAEKFPKCFLYCIGGSVKSLFIEREINPVFQPIIDKIVFKKRLISFSAGNDSYCSNTLNMNEFLPIFSSTLKELKIPFRALSSIPVDSVHPQNLTLTNFFNLILTTLNNDIKDGNFNSQFFSTVQKLSINDKTGRLFGVSTSFNIFIKHFSSLETLHFDMRYERYIKRDLSAMIKIIKESKFFYWPTVVYTVLSDSNFSKDKPARHLAICRNICKNFVYDSSNSIFHCFHQNFQTADSQNVAFKVLIPVKQQLSPERYQFIF